MHLVTYPSVIHLHLASGPLPPEGDRMTKKAKAFIGLTFLFSWLLILIFTLSGGKWNTIPAVIVAAVFMFVPMMVVIVLQKVVYREPMKEAMGISFKFNRWFLAAWFIPPAIAAAVLGITLLFPGIKFAPGIESMLALAMERFKDMYNPQQIQQMQEGVAKLPIHYFWIALIQGLVAGVTVNAVAGFGEESGWRGFLFRELLPLGFWRSSFIIGLVWGIWHAPIIILGHNYPQHPYTGVFMMIAWCMLLAPLFSYIRIKSKSVIAASILHGTLNGTAGLAVMVIKGGNDLTTGVTGIPGFIALAAVDLIIFLSIKKGDRLVF